MMPIVDAHVQLSEQHKLSDYLKQTSSFHVLRLIAVQQPQSAQRSLQQLNYLQGLSTTPGLGGFPNAVIAYCDFSRPESLSMLLEHSFAEKMCGVHYAPSTNDVTLWVDQLTVLQSRGMSLDVTVTASQCELVTSIAAQYPDLNIVINLCDWEASLDSTVTDQCIGKYAEYKNVVVKVCTNLINNTDSSVEHLQQFVESSVSQLGYDRIMFSTGPKTNSLPLSFDERWAECVNATSSMSARNREKLFRSNAVRVYKL